LPLKNLQIIGISLAVFLGAYLLFTLEPLVGKLVTPGFGGTITIWSGCMLFFQFALLGGYFLAYSLTRLNVKMQISVYAIILCVSLLFSKPPGLDAWICDNIDNPALSLIISLTQRLVLPFIVLSSISIIMQTWYQRLGLGDPYRLYSISNLGSVLALLAYPILLEPNLTLNNTVQWWSIGYIGMVAIILILAFNVLRHTPQQPDAKPQQLDATAKPTSQNLMYWCFLSASGSIALLAFTTYMTQDIAPIPLLWVLPLATYLITFIILFGNPAIYRRRLFSFIAMTLWLGELFVSRDDFVILEIVNLLLLFFMCMVFHGELVKSRPAPAFLPTFYVHMAFGGAIGGIFVNFIAPLIFTFYAERQLSVVFLVGLIASLVLTKNFRSSDGRAIATRFLSPLGEVMALVMGLLSIALCTVPYFMRTNVIAEQRNFYSSIQIEHDVIDGAKAISMVHGRVVHGIEFVDAKGEKTAGMYWEPVALAFDFARFSAAGNREALAPIPVPIKCGIVGLGVGFAASFGEPGDSIKYYELDPKVKTMAEQYFSYLKNSKAKVEFAIGDGRALLRDDSEVYDLLIVDAFNGDAIPVHLLTLESGRIYLKHLKPDGVFMVHASNRFLDLPPVVARLAKELQLNVVTVKLASSTYIILSKDPQMLEHLKELYHAKKYRPAVIEPTVADKCPQTWTDDYVNLFPLLRTEEAKE
jgi:Spermidine synthase